jgi:molybdopterin-guanine dinucleotide biosynthesis protein A
MGRDKAWLEIDGRPLVVWQADRLAGVFEDVRVSAKDGRPFAAAGLRVIEDGAEDFAAVRGIRAALAELRRPLFVLAVDLPRFPAALAGAIAASMLASGAACAAPVAGGYVHGLCAAYSPDALPAADAIIAGGRFAVRDLVTECRAMLLDESFWGSYAGPEAFANWNRPEDRETVAAR